LLPKSAKTHVRTYTISKNFPGLYPRTPFKKGRGREGRGEEGGGREGGEERRVEGWEGRGGREGRREGREEETEVWEGRERGMYASIHQAGFES
jgi:hypothetical protein